MRLARYVAESLQVERIAQSPPSAIYSLAIRKDSRKIPVALQIAAMKWFSRAGRSPASNHTRPRRHCHGVRVPGPEKYQGSHCPTINQFEANTYPEMITTNVAG